MGLQSRETRSDSDDAASELASRQHHTAAYIGKMAADLKKMALDVDLGFIAYLLDMTETESAAVARARIAGLPR